MSEYKKDDYIFLYSNLLDYYYELCIINPPGYESKMSVGEYIVISLGADDMYKWRSLNNTFKISILYPYVEKKIASMTTAQIEKMIEYLNPEIHAEMNRLCDKYNVYNINTFFFGLKHISVFDIATYYALEANYYKYYHKE